METAELVRHVDFTYAPGWSFQQCRRRRAFLMRVDESTVWIAAVDELNIAVVDDLRWLTKRSEVKIQKISDKTLNEMVALFSVW
jgi:hypothetical protein